MQEWMTIDNQKNVKHRATIGTVREFVEIGWLPDAASEYAHFCAVRDMFSKDIHIFKTASAARKHLRRIYC